MYSYMNTNSINQKRKKKGESHLTERGCLSLPNLPVVHQTDTCASLLERGNWVWCFSVNRNILPTTAVTTVRWGRQPQVRAMKQIAMNSVFPHSHSVTILFPFSFLEFWSFNHPHWMRNTPLQRMLDKLLTPTGTGHHPMATVSEPTEFTDMAQCSVRFAPTLKSRAGSRYRLPFER